MAKVLNFSHKVRNKEFRSWYGIHFQTNTLEEGVNLIIPSTLTISQIISLLFFYKDGIFMILIKNKETKLFAFVEK